MNAKQKISAPLSFTRKLLATVCAIFLIAIAATPLAANAQGYLTDKCYEDFKGLEGGEIGDDFVCGGLAQAADCIISIGTDCGKGEDAISFTQFSGGLAPPSPEGYSPELTQNKTAREFILNTTNFVLGFLGLLAVVIIIYGGFLYVTAAGNEDNATKGKKAVTYAMIGILLILASYAIVNTVIQAPSGQENSAFSELDEDLKGSPVDQADAYKALYRLAAADITSSADNFISSYMFFSAVRSAVESIRTIPVIGSPNDFNLLIANKRATLNAMEQRSNAFSNLRASIPQAQAVLIEYENLSKAAYAEFQKAKEAGEIRYGFWDAETLWLNEFWTTEEQGEFETSFSAALDIVKRANENDFANIIIAIIRSIEDLEKRIGSAASVPEIQAAFGTVLGELRSLVASSQTTLETSFLNRFMPLAKAQEFQAQLLLKPDLTNQEALRILQMLITLRDYVDDVVFVRAVITTNVSEGSAPLVVNFDGLRSVDPGQQTLTDFTWDFGDDVDLRAGNNTGVTTQHTFTKPGAYVVRLEIKSPSENVADGFATTRIIVREPTNKIYLKARIGQEEYILRSYDALSGTLLVDQGVLKATSAEAAAGIVFDASDTLSERIRSIRWSFGDNSPEVVQSGDAIQLSQTHKFPGLGSYTVFLEVTDIQNNIDRKIVTVVVGSPIARIIAPPISSIALNQAIKLDGGSSTSDGGQITEWLWQGITQDGVVVDGPTNREELTVRFTKPGTYKFTLRINDNLGNNDTADYTITVESAAPQAQFKYQVGNASQPSTVNFDGSLSYDPDGATKLTYEWTINNQKSGPSFSFIKGTNASSEKPVIKFSQKGEYQVGLKAVDPNGFGTGKPQVSKISEQKVIISNLLDVAWGTTDKPSAILAINEQSGEAEAKVTFTIVSEKAVGYEIDFGDNEIDSGTMRQTASVSHIYKTTGTLQVRLSVFDIEDDENTISRKVFIGSADTPVAVAAVQVNGEIVTDTTAPIVISRRDTVTFDAKNSLNTDGSPRRLEYSWDFGDDQRSTQETVNHTYRELGTYVARLKVTNANDTKQFSPFDTVTIQVNGEPPVLRSITAVPVGGSLETPVSVNVTAIGAEDPDGKITRYRWWYYDPSNDSDQLGVQVTQQPIATLNIGTRGTSGEEKTYRFAVEMTDEENNTVSSRSIIGEEQTASLTVINGPNSAPVAAFSVDRSSIFAGDTVNFVSSSRDSDGWIEDYFWDFEGDGFADNTQDLGPNVSHTYTTPVPEGIRVRLKVRDNNDSEAISEALMISVEGTSKAPSSAFTSSQQQGTTRVQFTDNSTADQAGGATLKKWNWDFDVSRDSGGDGKIDNDVDSAERNPVYDYKEPGLFRARLTVTDSVGKTASATNWVQVVQPQAQPPAGQNNLQQIVARLVTTPAPAQDGKIYLKGTSGNIKLDYSTSTGNIVSYVIDKNIYFDTNGNGILDDEKDCESTSPGQCTTDFHKEWGKIRLRLTVTDAAGRKDTIEREVIFEPQPISSAQTLSANVFTAGSISPSLLWALLVSKLGFVIIFTIRKIYKKRKNA